MYCATIFTAYGKQHSEIEAETFEGLLAQLTTNEQLTHIAYNNDQGDLIEMRESEVEGHPLDRAPVDILNHPSGVLRNPGYVGTSTKGKWVVAPVDRTQGWGFAIIEEA